MAEAYRYDNKTRIPREVELRMYQTIQADGGPNDTFSYIGKTDDENYAFWYWADGSPLVLVNESEYNSFLDGEFDEEFGLGEFEEDES